MKLLLILSVILITGMSADGCDEKKKETVRYKGRLEIKAICSNYTIKVLEGDIDTSMIQANWTDEHTNKAYTNVVGLGNPCKFPATIQQGDEFYFTIDTSKQEGCNVCLAYYPTPAKKLLIKVEDK